MPAENITLYAVFRKAIKANWVLSDPNAGSLVNNSTSCYKYNNVHSNTESHIDLNGDISRLIYEFCACETEKDIDDIIITKYKDDLYG